MEKELDSYAGLFRRFKPINTAFKFELPQERRHDFGELEISPSLIQKSTPRREDTQHAEYEIAPGLLRKSEPLDSCAGFGSPTVDEGEGSFTKAGRRFKVGDQVRVKSRGNKLATLTAIMRAYSTKDKKNSAFSLSADYDGGSLCGIFEADEIEAA